MWRFDGWARTGTIRDYTYNELRELTNRFANALRRLGVGPGDRVYSLAGRIPELYIAAIGTVEGGSKRRRGEESRRFNLAAHMSAVL